MDEAMKARQELREMIDNIRKALKNDKMGEMVISTQLITHLCNNGEGCSDVEHGNHHKDMITAERALEAATNKWVELRAHLAVASNALKPPKGWVATDPPEPKAGDLNVN